MAQNSVVILAARRTPIGSMLGTFATVAAPALGATALKAASPAPARTRRKSMKS